MLATESIYYKLAKQKTHLHYNIYTTQEHAFLNIINLPAASVPSQHITVNRTKKTILTMQQEERKFSLNRLESGQTI